MVKKVYIEGMTCDHCARRVENSIKSVEGVDSVKVDLQGKVATVSLSADVKDDDLIKAVDGAGYEVVKIEAGE